MVSAGTGLLLCQPQGTEESCPHPPAGVGEGDGEAARQQRFWSVVMQNEVFKLSEMPCCRYVSSTV